ncbi:MAG: helix-turn-helix domain-containing protein [Gammaproteobacteria bacterium]
MKKYKVTLTAAERAQLSGLIGAGKAAAQKLAHARILLKADAAEGGPGWADARIAEAVEVSVATVERVRQRFTIEHGLDEALNRASPRFAPAAGVSWMGQPKARLIALACGAPPAGRAGGRCNCWPSGWWSYGWWIGSATRRCAAR